MDEIDDLVQETEAVAHRHWFVRRVHIVDRTDSTITMRLSIGDNLFIQVFFSSRNQRLSLALVGSGGRLYGRDREGDVWHLHPFNDPDRHESSPVGVSPAPIAQFLAEVEQILVDNDLI